MMCRGRRTLFAPRAGAGACPLRGRDGGHRRDHRPDLQFGSGGFVVVVVEALDHLKRPAALEYVTSDQVVPHRAGVAAMTGLVEHHGALLEEKVGPPDELVEGV